MAANDDLRSQAMARVAANARAEVAEGRRRPRSSSPTSTTRRPRSAAAAAPSSSTPATAPLPAAADDDEHQDDEAAASGAEDQGDDGAGDDDEEERTPRDYRVEGAGALLALFLYPAAVNLLTGGPAQMWGWFKAKWVNQPYGGQPAGAAGPTQATSSAAGPTPTGAPPQQSALLPYQLGLTSQP